MKKLSVAFRLSFKFAIILTIAVLSIIFAFFASLHRMSRQQEERWMQRSLKMIAGNFEKDSPETFQKKLNDMPFFISYLICDETTGTILYQRNDRIPLLPVSNNRSKIFSKKKFFSQSEEDLNIVYISDSFKINDNSKIIIQLAQNNIVNRNRGANSNLSKMIALCAIPILVLCFLISLFITKNTMQPVVKMTKAAAQLSSSNLDSLLPETGRQDELDKLAHTFNLLFKRLKNDFDRERNFTSNVSHELKTPVAVILGQANLLRRWGKNDPAQLEKSIDTILQESRSMESIISNLLQLSRLESGRIKPQKEIIMLNDLFERTANEFKSVCPTLKFEYPEYPIQLKTDGELLHQVMTAVISNSLKFTGENPEIKIHCTQKKKKTVIQIEDNGPGFDEEIIPHVFERFFRGDSSHNRQAGGSGLGLSISQAIVHSLSGKISASNSQNHGAVISITL